MQIPSLRTDRKDGQDRKDPPERKNVWKRKVTLDVNSSTQPSFAPPEQGASKKPTPSRSATPEDSEDFEKKVGAMFKGPGPGVNMVFVLPDEFRSPSAEQTAESMAQLSLGPAAIIFEKPIDRKYRHLKPLYLKGFINGKPVGGMLVDTGAAINVMPYSLCEKFGRSKEDLVLTSVTLSDFKGEASAVIGVLTVDLSIGKKTVSTSFFVVNSEGPYAVLLGRDWIHANCCVPSTMHRCLIQWDGDEVEVVPADESFGVSLADAQLWVPDGAECLSGREAYHWSFVHAAKNGMTPVPAAGVEL